MSTPFFENFFTNRFINRIGHKAAFALAMLLCLLWSTAAALRTAPEPAAAAASHEWPREWDGAPLRPMPLRTSKAPRVRKGQAPGKLQRDRFHERFMYTESPTPKVAI